MAKPPKKILIVEDEKLLRESLVDRFTKEGFATFGATNGEEGLTAAKVEQPDLIMLDLVMPVMDGHTMLQKLRAEDWGKDIPVIILTNMQDTQDVSRAVTNEAFDYMVKTDWHLEEIVKKVKNRLKM